MPPERRRLDVAVAERLGVSRSAAQALIEAGRVTVDGEQRPKRHLVGPERIEVEEVPE